MCHAEVALPCWGKVFISEKEEKHKVWYDIDLFFYLCFTARQDYLHSFEPGQSLGGAKMGDPREKPPDHPQAELGLSHIRPELGSNPQRWAAEQFKC